MPIPDRLRPPPPTAEEMAHYSDLCLRIEGGSANAETSEMIDRWNRRAARPYSHDEFRYYQASTSCESFVTTMLLGKPSVIPDLTYGELRDVVETVMTAAASEAELNYFIEWLEANLPDSNITNLIYWPNHWFNDESLLHAELNPDQILAYAMMRSGRLIPGAPENVPLPYPIPPRTGA
ncbi:MAG TPA: hypothetical protein VM529_25145 [Gemmata sp.]|nr:hypothetical protein [Gemmata sp.]